MLASKHQVVELGFKRAAVFWFLLDNNGFFDEYLIILKKYTCTCGKP
jgi:hypothetical protein